jgi:hypothetical protein
MSEEMAVAKVLGLTTLLKFKVGGKLLKD